MPAKVLNEAFNEGVDYIHQTSMDQLEELKEKTKEDPLYGFTKELFGSGVDEEIEALRAIAEKAKELSPFGKD